MLTEKEIGYELIGATREIVNKKLQNENDNESNLYYGFAFGLIAALGRIDEFKKTDNQLGYINTVIEDIFKDELANKK